jgi:hypothetical protein
MRHDPAGAAIVIMLRSLKMPGMAHAVQDLLDQGAPAFEAATRFLGRSSDHQVTSAPYDSEKSNE